jgi:hypothetical protein
LKKKIAVVAILGLVVLSVSSSGCFSFPANDDVRMSSSIVAKWIGGNSISPAGLRVSGQLVDVNSKLGIAGKPIVLYGSNDATFDQPNPQVPDMQKVTEVQLDTKTTDSKGNFAFTLKGSADKYLIYAVVFPGDQLNNVANYKPSGSTVGGYRALLAITSQLTKEMAALPSTALKPGTKVALLATLGTVSMQIKLGRFSTASATLNSAFLKRLDGYANSGAPDNNDYVKTNAAQYTMYYRAYLVVQDCQLLLGKEVQIAGAPAAPQ